MLCLRTGCLSFLAMLAAAYGAADETPTLPLKRVVLFTSGVALVEHRGEVEGNCEVHLDFHVEDVNDLLKSMVVRDDGGGHIEMVTYAPQEPLAVTLGNLRVDPSRVRSLGDLLGQLRGQQVQLELTPNTITGAIVAVDRRQTLVGDERMAEVETLLIKTKEGLRNVPLGNIVSLKLSDEALNRDLEQALEMLASAATQEKKQVTLRLRGEGKRPIRVAYVLEAPVWKTSYRLVVDEKEPLLQGWAIVENTSEQDWNDVEVALVSGRPVSFVMDLYQPMFLERPVVVPELFAGLRPRVHDQDLAAKEEAFRAAAQFGGGFGGGLGGMGGLGGGSRPFVTSVAPVMDGASSVQVAARGAEIGSFFRYAIERPVTLARQKSAMLPIVNDKVKVARRALYDPATHDKHPLAAVELTNSTKTHWMQGPVTLFDGGEYAGDAQIADIPPGSKRLVTYALDLNIEVVPGAVVAEKEVVTHVKIERGRITAKKSQRRARSFTVKNSGAAARQVIIEQEITPEWKLLEPEPSERTRDLYRFAIAGAPGVPAELRVVEERETEMVVEMVATVADDPFGERKPSSIDWQSGYELAQSHPQPSAALQKALAAWREKQQAVVAAQQAVSDINARLAEISAEQDRIRKNLPLLPADSDLQRTYIKTLADQETELKQLRISLAEGQTVAAEQRAALEKFLRELEAE